MEQQLLTKILDAIQLGNSRNEPLAIHVSGTVSYIIYPIISTGEGAGYPVKRITEVTSEHTYFDKGFVLETDRVAGLNGSGANVNIKVDTANALLLLTDASIVYG